VPTVAESGIEIRFPDGVICTKHDAENSIWPGVDFIFDGGDAWIWLEIKNWRRAGPKRKTLSELNSKLWFEDNLVPKFLGTTSYLAHRGVFVSKPLTYVALLESSPLNRDIMVNANKLIRQHIRPSGPWKSPLMAVVVSLAEWNLRYPDYPARAI
jgi:hypothetical protein